LFFEAVEHYVTTARGASKKRRKKKKGEDGPWEGELRQEQ